MPDRLLGSDWGDHPVLAEIMDQALGPRMVTIRAADTEGHRSSANILVHSRYATRGYKTSFESSASANVVTLIATDRQQTIGTVSMRFDSPSGLLAGDSFPEEIEQLRARGCRICEFTKLAVDDAVKSKRVLASLFHTAYIWAYRLMGFGAAIIEVNPRHVRYYERALGFAVIGPERLNRRVDAPAVLLYLDLAQARQHAERFAAEAKPSAGERSLYPYFFSAKEEEGIVARLPRAQEGPKT